MYKYFYLAFLLITFQGFAQNIKISGKVSGSPDTEVAINLPVDGKYFAGNNTSVKIANGSYSYEAPLQQPGFVTVSNNFNSATIYAEPGKSYSLNFDRDDFSFFGENAAVQELLYDLGTHQDIRRNIKPDDHKTFSEKEKFYADLLHQQTQKLQDALSTQLITQEQYNRFLNIVILKNLEYKSTDYYFTYRKNYENNKELLPEFQAVYIKSWEKAFQTAYANPEFLASPDFVKFSERMKGMDDIKTTGALNFDSGAIPYSIYLINYYRESLPGNLLEYAWANKIYGGIAENHFEKEWLANYDDFKKTFPNSKLTALLAPYIKKVEDYHDENKKVNITFVDNYEKIDSFQELFAKLKGKVIYVDMWATWCAPCRIELQYSKKNHKTLEDMDVVPIYLSLDDDKADALWKSMMKNLQLTGLHMRANPTFKTEIDKVTKAGIPHYIIVGKDGEVKEWKAKRPSDQQDLFNQLKQYTNP